MKKPPAQKKKDTAEKIFYNLSLETHKYNKSKTTTLTKLKNLVQDPFPHIPPPGICTATSEERLYLPQRDHARFSDGEAPKSNNPQKPFAKDYARIVHSHSFRRLQGKSQLIPAGENEFFRNRLTHSIEVGDIATRIADNINATHDFFKLEGNEIDIDLMTCAGFLHDIGHPPFGHSGEEVLNDLMGEYGGFEGNAQTLRLVTKLENRLGINVGVETAYAKPRGLNLTVRTLASVIKYDKQIVPEKKEDGYKIVKGYYETEAEIVDFVRTCLNLDNEEQLQSIECQIMDLADDIAYSAYDLEDAMVAGIIRPFDLISVHDDTLDAIKNDVNKQMKKRFPQVAEVCTETVLITLARVFGDTLEFAKKNEYDLNKMNDRITFVGRSYGESILQAENPLIRRQFLETLIQRSIDSIVVCLNKDKPFQSRVEISYERLLMIECLKAFNFHKVIATKRIQMAQYRSRRILQGLFEALEQDLPRGYLLTNQQKRYRDHLNGSNDCKRFVCDIIASLSDLEAVRLFHRLNGDGTSNFGEYV